MVFNGEKQGAGKRIFDKKKGLLYFLQAIEKLL